MKWRHCETDLARTFVDLGSPPSSNSHLTAEIMEQHEYVREWGGQVVTAVPELVVE